MKTNPYVIHGVPVSLFTRKLESAFTLYGVPYIQESKGRNDGSDLEKRAGTHQVPILVTPENWVLADTTPILKLMDGRYPARRLFPDGPLGVLVHVVEEILDEWVTRIMVHYRWHYAENTRDVISFFTGEDVPLEEAEKHPVAQWGPRACRAMGTDLPEHRQAAEDEYIALMSALDKQLNSTAYALGNRPSAVDAILLGGLRAHTNRDPYPDLSGFRNVMAWDKERADTWDGTGELSPFDQTTPLAEHILDLGREHYVPFLLGNAAALESGQETFSVNSYGTPCSYLTRPYPEQSRRMIQDHVANELSADDRALVTTWLKAGGFECFLP